MSMQTGSLPFAQIPEDEIKPVDCKITVTVLERGMRAVFSASAPENGGCEADEPLLRYALEKKRVTAGIDEAALLAFCASPAYGTDVEIARGQQPQNGVDGSLEYLFNTKVTLRPKENADGTVDYHELGLIQHVEQGQTLVEKTPATLGVDGFNVMGLKLRARNGRDPAFPVGKNTAVSEDGLELLATATGHVEVIGNKVTVLDTYTVRGDVGTSTGNIQFDGSVVISGSVSAGFVVHATNNITINGACEAATLIAGENIVIGEGMNGGRIEAGGDIKSKYLQSCNVQAGGNVFAGAIINCTTRCTGTVSLTGPKGTLVGGTCVAGQAIEASYIGSENTYIQTKLEVGLDPQVQKRLHEVPGEISASTAMIDRLDQLLDLLRQLQAAGRMDEEKQVQYQNALHTREVERTRILALEQELVSLQEKSRELGRGYVLAKRVLSPGVRVTIGPYKKTFQEPVTITKVTRGSGRLDVLPAI